MEKDQIAIQAFFRRGWEGREESSRYWSSSEDSHCQEITGNIKIFFRYVNVSLLVVYSLFFLYLMVFMSVCPMSTGLLAGKQFFHQVEIKVLIWWAGSFGSLNPNVLLIKGGGKSYFPQLWVTVSGVSGMGKGREVLPGACAWSFPREILEELCWKSVFCKWS